MEKTTHTLPWEEDFQYTYASMPKYEQEVPGMKILPGDPSHTRGMAVPDDVFYETVDGQKLRLRFLYPDPITEREKYPLMIHIQGSGWMPQDLNDHLLEFREIAENGIAVAIVEYRSLPEHRFPAQIEDAKAAIHFIQENHRMLRIDPEHLFLSGDSSGGHTALMCWATWKDRLFNPRGYTLPPIHACIDFYGIVDFLTMHLQSCALDYSSPESFTALELGIHPSKDPDRAGKAGVLHYLREDTATAPLLILHGNKDRWVPFEQSIQLFEACRRLKKQVEFYCIDEGDHGGSAFYCQNTIQAVVAYLKRFL